MCRCKCVDIIYIRIGHLVNRICSPHYTTAAIFQNPLLPSEPAQLVGNDSACDVNVVHVERQLVLRHHCDSPCVDFDSVLLVQTPQRRLHNNFSESFQIRT